MIEHVWSVLCSDAFIDKETNRASLSTMEAATVGGKLEAPDGKRVLVPMRIILVSMWFDREGGSPFEYRVVTVAPDGTSDDHDIVVGNFLPNVRRIRTTLNFPGVLYCGEGYYYYRVKLRVGDEWVAKAEVPLEVRIGTPAFLEAQLARERDEH